MKSGRLGMVIKMSNLELDLNQLNIKQIKNLKELVEEYNNELGNQVDIIEAIKKYVDEEISSYTETIKDYIDDDKIGNKDIIGELKEQREHWKDIIRIMNKEKTYMEW